MSGSLIIFIIVHLVALVYFVEMLRRISNKSKEYDLNEDSRTLPFGFVRLRYVVIAYILAYAVWFIASFFFYIYFIAQTATLGGVTVDSIRDFDLNL